MKIENFDENPKLKKVLIPYFKIGSKSLFTKEILDEYINDSLEKPNSEEKEKKYSFKDF